MNCYDYIDVNTPFGGYKNSGIGKELGEDGLSNYLETKTVIIKRGYLWNTNTNYNINYFK